MSEKTLDTGNWRAGASAADVLKMAEGATVLSVDDSDDPTITTDRGTLSFYHEQDCCELVGLEEVVGGALADLIGQVIVEAREDADADGPEPEYADSYTWTFYTIRTNRATITLRFLGESNGYYSERMDVRWVPA